MYAMFGEYKRLFLAAISSNTNVNYQRLQYFFTESNWSTQELNDIRLRVMQNQRTTQTKMASLHLKLCAYGQLAQLEHLVQLDYKKLLCTQQSTVFIPGRKIRIKN
jgi:hypothetical protein